MKSSKNIFLIGFLCLAGMLTSGCKKSEKTSTAADSKEIVFWHWWTDRQSLLEKFSAEYKQKTGVSVRFQVAAPVGSDYNSKLQAAAQANTLPDIIGIAAGGEMLARYINAGKIYELTGAMNQGWKKNFFPRAVEDFYYEKGNPYGVKADSYWAAPISAMAIQIYYNKDLFKKAGLDPEKPPQTWKSFIETSKKLKEKNIIPFTVGFGDLWMIGSFLEPYAWSYLAKEKMKQLLLEKAPAEIAGVKVDEIRTMDGVKYILADDSWLLVRPSGTEPVLRVYAEGRTSEMVQAMIGFGEDVAANVN